MRNKILISLLGITLLALSLMLVLSIKNNNKLQEAYIENSISKPLMRLASQLSLINQQFDEMIDGDEIGLEKLEVLTNHTSRTNLYFSDFRNHYNELFKEEDSLAITNQSFERDLLIVQVNLQSIQDDMQRNGDIDEESMWKLLKESAEYIIYYNELLSPYEQTPLSEKMKGIKELKKSKEWKQFIYKINEKEL